MSANSKPKSKLKVVISDFYPHLDPQAAERPPAPARQFIIRGVTRSGQRFRPSDWAERLYYAVASYGPYREVQFNPLVMLKVEQGVKGIAVDMQLRESDSMTYDFLVDFARGNDLQVVDPSGQPLEL